jgi:hypothetical protein
MIYLIGEEKDSSNNEIGSLEDGDDNISPKRRREQDWKHFPTGST